MALEILKEGRNIIEDEKKTTVCPRCGCEFSYHQSDCTMDTRNDIYVICPNSTCNQYIDVTRLNTIR